MATATSNRWHAPHHSVPDCVEALQDALLQSPSIFGRLVTLSSRRNKVSDLYEHDLAERFGVNTVDRILRQLHIEIFLYWLGLRLRQQEADLAAFLAHIEDRSTVLSGLEEAARDLLPPEHFAPQRDLFLEDLRIVTWLLRKGQRTDD